MTCITFAVNNVALDDQAGRWRLLKTTTVGPGFTVRAVDVAVPGMDGTVAVGYEPLDAPSQLFKMGVYGHDHTSLMRNYGAVLRLLAPTSPVVLSKHVGSVERTVVARGKSTTAPEFFPAGKRLTFTAEMRLPGVYWRGMESEWTRSPAVSGDVYEVTTLADSTAPVDDALVLIAGPATSPKVSCGDSWFQLSLSLSAGESALVDCKKWTVRAGSGVTFAGGGSVKTGKLVSSGGPYLLRLQPESSTSDPVDTQVNVSLSGAGFTGATSLSVKARPAYVV